MGQKRTFRSAIAMSALPQKRTSLSVTGMSAKCQKQTWSSYSIPSVYSRNDSEMVSPIA
jgi:hypothetical protein